MRLDRGQIEQHSEGTWGWRAGLDCGLRNGAEDPIEMKTLGLEARGRRKRRPIQLGLC